MKELVVAGCIFVTAASVGYADAASSWSYDAERQTLSDGVWTLVVTNTSARELVLGPGAGSRSDGRTAAPWALPNGFEPPEAGAPLDLSKPVYTKGTTDEAWTIVQMTFQCFKGVQGLTAFTAPTTLKTYDGQAFNEVNSLTEVVFRCPDLSPNYCTHGYDYGKSPISRLVLDLPKVTRIWNVNFSGATFADSDLAEWNLTGLRQVDAEALKAGGKAGAGPKGVLDLPNAETIGDRAFLNWTRLSSAAFGTNGTLKSLGGSVFRNDAGTAAAGPTKLDFGKSHDFTVAADALLSTDDAPIPLKELWFAGPAPSRTALDNLLARQTAGADGAKPVAIYVPSYERSWWRMRSPFEDGEAAAAQAVGGDVAGVYETQDGRRVAWLVNRADLVLPTWEYDAAAQTITDGRWTLAVANTAGRDLLLGPAAAARADGRTAKPWAFPAEIGTVYEELNMEGPIYTKGEAGNAAETWQITAIADGAFSSMPGGLKTFRAPTTLRTFGYAVFADVDSLTEAVFNCPELEGTFASGGGSNGTREFSPCNIARLVLNLPKVAQLGNGRAYNFANSHFLSTDLADWDLSGVTNLCYGALMCGTQTGTKTSRGPVGDLVLPNVAVVGNGALDNWTRLSSIAFGTNGTLKSIGKNFIWNGTGAAMLGPRKIDFGTSWDFTVDADAFTGNDYPEKGKTPFPIEEVWFAGPAPGVETLDRILALQTVAADGAKPVTIYAPMAERTWKARCRAFEGDEAAAAQALRAATGARLVGVYETQDGRRVAWLAQNPNIPYRTGGVILIR